MDLTLAKQPAPGRTGAPYVAYANLFVVKECPTTSIYHYDSETSHLFEASFVNRIDYTQSVYIYPEVKNRHKCKRIFEKLRTHIAPEVFTVACAFDGAKNLFAIGKPPVDATRSFEVNISDKPPQPSRPSQGIYQFTMTKVNVISPRDLRTILDGQTTGVATATTAIQALNVLVSEAAAIRFRVHTRNKFFVDANVDVFKGVEIWRGFFQTLRPACKQLLVNVDMATGVMYQRGPLLEFVKEYFEVRDMRYLSRVDTDTTLFHLMRSILKGLKIRQSHSGKLRTIKSITPHAGDYEFRTTDGLTTVDEYFRDVKGRRLKYPKYPGIITSRDEVVPFELCEVLEGQIFRKRLSRDITDRMLRAAKKTPAERFAIIMKGMKALAIQDSPFLAQAGMKISADPLEVTGRILNPPNLLFGEKSLIRPEAGAWRMGYGSSLAEPKSITCWSVINLDSTLDERDIRIFVNKLVKSMKNVGMVVKMDNPEILTKFGSLDGIQDELQDKRFPTILLVVIPEHGSALRKTVKQFGDIRFGIPTQCVLSNHISSAKNAYLNNLILKINAKIGGVNTIPCGPAIDWFKDGNSIVIGADVTHPAPGVARPSVAALVASVDVTGSRYIARCSVQAPRLEIIQDLKQMMIYMLRMFYQYRSFVCKTGKVPLFPQKIIFFRDGVSEGEIQTVVNYEIAELQRAVREFYAQSKVDMQPKITFIVVGKRHHVRFLPKEPQTADRSGNCPAGFVVDNDLTCPGIWDFYLQSQEGLLGTSRPSHYIVIKDDNDFSSDSLQNFIFALCHGHARSMRSVSIPAPVYYADIVCSRADIHFNPALNYSDDASYDGIEMDMQAWMNGFCNVHRHQSTNMYFM